MIFYFKDRFWRETFVTALGLSLFVRIGFSTEENEQIGPTIISAASQMGNCVISCRDIMDASGNLKRGKSGSWTALNCSGTHLLGEERSGSTAVVFVHGYNTSYDDAVSRGNLLWEHLRAASKSRTFKDKLYANPFQGAFFFTFCWRGDVDFANVPGTSWLNFPGSVRAAKDSAPSFSAFLKELHTQLLARGPFKLVVITHSLGAEVALEAFNRLSLESTGWVTGTLLVQPAVTIDSVTAADFPDGFAEHGLPMMIKGKLTYPNNVDWVTRRHWLLRRRDFIPAHHEEGEYFRAFAFSQKAAVTMSHTDAAVSLAFSFFSGGTLFHIFSNWDPRWAESGIAGTEIKPHFGVPDKEEALYDLTPPPRGELIYPSNLSMLDISTDAPFIALNGIEHNRLFDDSKLAEQLYQEVLLDWLVCK